MSRVDPTSYRRGKAIVSAGSFLTVAALLFLPASSLSADRPNATLSDNKDLEGFCRSLRAQVGRLPPNTPLNRWSERLEYPDLRRPDWRAADPVAEHRLLFDLLTSTRPAGSTVDQKHLTDGDVRFERAVVESEFGQVELYRVQYASIDWGTLRVSKRMPGPTTYWRYAVRSVAGNPKIRDYIVKFNTLGFDVFNQGRRLYWVAEPFGPIHYIDFTPSDEQPSLGTACRILLPLRG